MMLELKLSSELCRSFSFYEKKGGKIAVGWEEVPYIIANQQYLTKIC